MSDATKPIDDGGPAFPAEGGYASGLHPAPGMSLRDYFAAQALAGLAGMGPKVAEAIQQKAFREDSGPTLSMARVAYDFADAMLAERAKRGGE